MFDYSIIYLLNTDQREAALHLLRMADIYIESIHSTFMIVMWIQLLLVLIIFMQFRAYEFIMIYLLLNRMYYVRECFNKIERLTAIRTRLGTFRFVLKEIWYAVVTLVFPKRLGAEDKDILDAIKIDISSRFKHNNKTWDRLNGGMTKFDDKHIDKYWQDLGLTNSKVNSISKCISFSCKEPLNPYTTQRECFDLREMLAVDSVVNEITQKWVAADMTDEMHVKSIYKRLCGQKTEVDNKSIIKLKDDLIEFQSKLDLVKMTQTGKISLALGTQGSAGQFAKRSMYENIWKNKNSEESVELWHQLVNLIFEMVFVTNYIDEGLVQYMLYRKQEALKKNEDNQIKPTRLMNSPNLIMRVPDSVAFTEFNDAIVKSREKYMPSLGMNIFIELKMILTYNPKYSYIVSDFGDYDGTQHPAQGFAVCMARLEYMIRNKSDIKQIAYMPARYGRHMERFVKSTAGIGYNVIGQQASGDITTADDNTCKTIGFMTNVIERMVNQGLITNTNSDNDNNPISSITPKIGVDITSDDTGLAVVLSEKSNTITIEKIYQEEATKYGWTIKPESFGVTRMLQDGKNEYLSHSVQRRRIMSRNKTYEFEMAFLVRPIDRAMAKLCIAAEIDKKIGPLSRSKLASKYLTGIMTSIGNPQLIALSIYGLMIVRSRSSDYTGSYSWQGIKATTVNELDLNTMVKLQLGARISMRIDWLELFPTEVVQVKQILSETKMFVQTIMLKYGLKVEEAYMDNFAIIDNEGRWNVRSAVKTLVTIYKQFDKMSALSKPQDAIQWWNTITIEPEIPDHKEIGEILCCEHIKESLVDKSTIKYTIIVKCESCYRNNEESRYCQISIKQVNKDGKKLTRVTTL